MALLELRVRTAGRTGSAPAARTPSRWRPSEAALVAVAVGTLELALAVVIVLGLDAIPHDSLARTANASYVLDSRDPSLSAIGFVWSPLPSLLLLPFVLLGHLVPDLVSRGLAICIESAAAAAGCAVVVRGIASDLGLRRAPRLLLVALFALHPFLVLYGANGMTEELLLLWLLVATRSLCRWLRSGEASDLVPAALSLALAYLTRYEAFGAAAVAGGAVAVVTAVRTSGPLRARAVTAATDLVLVAGPAAVAAVGFAVTSWLVVGHPFEQLSSRNGNSAQLAATGKHATALAQVLAQQRLLEPFGWVVLGVAVLVCLARRDLRILALGVLGGPLAFSVAASVSGSTFGWLRFQVYVVPLTVVSLAFVLAPAERPWSPVSGSLRAVRRAGLSAVGVAMAAAAAAPVFTVPGALTDPALAPEEAGLVSRLLDRPVGEAASRQQVLFADDRAVAAYLDRRHLPAGSVLVDSAVGYPVILASGQPHQFVITSDGDFAKANADPRVTDVSYLLVSDQQGYDALDLLHPGLYATGAGLGRLVREFPNRDQPQRSWRLYRVLPRDLHRAGRSAG